MKQDDQHIVCLFVCFFSNCTKFTIIKMQTFEATQTEQNSGGQHVSRVFVLFRLLFEFSLQTTVDIFVLLPGADKPKGLPGLFQLFRTC